MPSRADAPRHFSMLRGFHLADLFTLANAACGVASLFASMTFVAAGHMAAFFVSAGLAPLALVFDALDGRVARWRQRHSAMGRELDSLSDVISFGVAPAGLAFAAGMRGGWDWLVLVLFVAAGVSRLARFNVTADELSEGKDKVAYFEGAPIPTSVLLVGLLAVAGWQGRIGEALYLGKVTLGPFDLHPLVLAFLLWGGLMISKTLRIPKI
jgi:CDP-diacylglycerol--serine O-phosphatidyltransferase